VKRPEEAPPDPRRNEVRAAASALRALPPQPPEPAPRGPALGDARVEALFREYAPKVYALARRFGFDADEAEDGVQEVFLKIQRRIGTFRGDSALSTWLYQVAVNALRDHRRKQLRLKRALPFQDAPGAEAVSEPAEQRIPATTATPVDDAARTERSLLVRAALDRLPTHFREVLVLRELEGWSYRDIARVLGLAQGTVESRIFRARGRLAAELRRQEESL
jgi:RNA polymerase sigma-70 factor (ECF subfamily)